MKWVDFKYERFLYFCYICGVLRYFDKDCYMWDDDGEVILDLVYGEILRVSFLKRVLWEV